MVNLEIGEGSTGSFSNFEVLLEVLSGPQNVEKIHKLSNIPIRTRIISIVQNWINCPSKLLTQFLQAKRSGVRTFSKPKWVSPTPVRQDYLCGFMMFYRF